MGKMVVTLMNSKTNVVVTVTVPHRRNQFIWQVHEKILKEHPGFYIRKSKTFS